MGILLDTKNPSIPPEKESSHERDVEQWKDKWYCRKICGVILEKYEKEENK